VIADPPPSAASRLAIGATLILAGVLVAAAILFTPLI
jgi:hypothetical protein